MFNKANNQWKFCCLYNNLSSTKRIRASSLFMFHVYLKTFNGLIHTCEISTRTKHKIKLWYSYGAKQAISTSRQATRNKHKPQELHVQKKKAKVLLSRGCAYACFTPVDTTISFVLIYAYFTSVIISLKEQLHEQVLFKFTELQLFVFSWLILDNSCILGDELRQRLISGYKWRLEHVLGQTCPHFVKFCMPCSF